jgi:hypothetical protein
VWEKSEQSPNAVTTSANFKNQSQELQNALNQLVILPSASNLMSARGSLTRFQSQFKSWMSVAVQENPYQVKV